MGIERTALSYKTIETHRSKLVYRIYFSAINILVKLIDITATLKVERKSFIWNKWHTNATFNLTRQTE